MRIYLQFTVKYRINFATHYMFTVKPKMLINTKSGRVINQIMKGSTIGYIINSKFYSLTKLREHLELIPIKEITPF
jgi:hypothetical protein